MTHFLPVFFRPDEVNFMLSSHPKIVNLRHDEGATELLVVSLLFLLEQRAFQTYKGLPNTCSPNLILKFMKHMTLTYWLSNKDEVIPQDIIDTVNGDISDNDFT